MIFSLVKLGAVKQRDKGYEYFSKIMELAGSEKFTNTFESADEMINVVNPILATQRKPRRLDPGKDSRPRCVLFRPRHDQTSGRTAWLEAGGKESCTQSTHPY